IYPRQLAPPRARCRSRSSSGSSLPRAAPSRQGARASLGPPFLERNAESTIPERGGVARPRAGSDSSRDVGRLSVLVELDVVRCCPRARAAPYVDLARAINANCRNAQEPRQEIVSGGDFVDAIRAKLADVQLVVAHEAKDEIRGPFVVLLTPRQRRI